jgi:hypothetical protein
VICASILIGAWVLLPENYFVVFLIGFIILTSIFEYFVKQYENGKKTRTKGFLSNKPFKVVDITCHYSRLPGQDGLGRLRVHIALSTA